jgi:hypothetical protein
VHGQTVPGSWPATENDLSSSVDRRDAGTTSSTFIIRPQMTMCSDGSGPLKQLAEVRQSSHFMAAIDQRALFEGYTLQNPEPMELTKYRRDAIVTPTRINQTHLTVEDSLITKTSWGSSQRRVVVVLPQCLDDCQKSMTQQSALNATDLPERRITQDEHV